MTCLHETSEINKSSQTRFNLSRYDTSRSVNHRMQNMQSSQDKVTDLIIIAELNSYQTVLENSYRLNWSENSLQRLYKNHIHY